MTLAPCPRSDSAQPLPTSPYPQTTATFPPIRTSVARLMPSMSECRQPCLLSNLLLVTEPFTLMPGKSSEPSFIMSYIRSTPVVVSSVTPLISLATVVQRLASSARDLFRTSKTTFCSTLFADSGEGATPLFSAWTPRCTSIVASPPSSRIMLANRLPGQLRICCVHHQYSSSVSPFQANTGTPFGSSGVPSGPTATAAAAWSWVEKMLHDAH